MDVLYHTRAHSLSPRLLRALSFRSRRFCQIFLHLSRGLYKFHFFPCSYFSSDEFCWQITLLGYWLMAWDPSVYILLCFIRWDLREDFHVHVHVRHWSALEDALGTVPPRCSECNQHSVHFTLKCRKDLTKHTIKLGCFLCRKVLNYELKNFNGYKLFCFQPGAQCCHQFCTVSWIWQKPLRIRVSWSLGIKRAKHPGCLHSLWPWDTNFDKVVTFNKFIHFIKVVRYVLLKLLLLFLAY